MPSHRYLNIGEKVQKVKPTGGKVVTHEKWNLVMLCPSLEWVGKMGLRLGGSGGEKKKKKYQIARYRIDILPREWEGRGEGDGCFVILLCSLNRVQWKICVNDGCWRGYVGEQFIDAFYGRKGDFILDLILKDMHKMIFDWFIHKMNISFYHLTHTFSKTHNIIMKKPTNSSYLHNANNLTYNSHSTR